MRRNRLAARAVRLGRTDAIGQRAAEIVEQEERDLAVIARIGGNKYRRVLADPYVMASNPDAEVAEWVTDAYEYRRRPGPTATLPESAFDWPVYAAAMRERYEDAPLSVQYRRARAASRRLHPEMDGYDG